MDMNTFFPPMVGSFLGVITAFILNYIYQKYNTNEDKKKFKNMIRSELEQCVNVLKLDNVQLLPVDRWNSAVNSGALKLFNVENELISLSMDYYRINNYNDMVVQHELMGRSWIEIKTTWPTVQPFERFIYTRNWLLNDLKKLESAEWPNSTNGAVLEDGFKPYGTYLEEALIQKMKRK